MKRLSTFKLDYVPGVLVLDWKMSMYLLKGRRLRMLKICLWKRGIMIMALVRKGIVVKGIGRVMLINDWMFQSLLHDEYIALSNEEIVRMTFDLPYCPTDGTILEPFFVARIQSLMKRIIVGIASSAPPSATVCPLSLSAPSPANCQRLADYASPSNVGTPIVTASTVVSALPAAMFTPSPAPCVIPAPVSPSAQLHVRIGGLPEVTLSTFDIAVYESLASVGPKNVHAHLFYLDSSHRLQDITQAAEELYTDMNTWRSVDAAIHLDYHRQRQSRFQTFEDYRRKVLQQSSVRDMLREFRSTDGS
ncbi:hypothetical protein CBR_g49022 [Chara braunii]|uniref:Uncharacterized protein n=1 Tax=Chara braunii TaxID=69332 RepID=A0A388M4A3_CHABU|nr:hypothetical protein CBR_g49022 [Chara braunii]|eukprot:GBG89312.1 hypothetical protein CBR_g49022 [Chara braunii]